MKNKFKKIVLLNGPPRSGKDTAAELIQNKLKEKHPVARCKFATGLRCMAEAAIEASGLLDESAEIVPLFFCDAFKDTKQSSLCGRTPREVLIQMSEGFVKPLFGKDFFGKVLAHEIKKVKTTRTSLFLISDSGFTEEAKVLVEKFGAENILLIRLHADGTSFRGDSRSYISLNDVYSVDVHNPMTEEGLWENLKSAVTAFLAN